MGWARGRGAFCTSRSPRGTTLHAAPRKIYSDSAQTQAAGETRPPRMDWAITISMPAPGRYMIEISGPGITIKQIPNVLLPSEPKHTYLHQRHDDQRDLRVFRCRSRGTLTVNGFDSGSRFRSRSAACRYPASNQDNQWTAGQAVLRGRSPWRDISGYNASRGGC